MMAALTGMDVSNASLYDGASALAEAVLMAVRANRRSKSTASSCPPGEPGLPAVPAAIVGNQGSSFEDVPYDPHTGHRCRQAWALGRRGRHRAGDPAAQLLRRATRTSPMR
jgi:hypothetical protein